jgi:hypothetical protein
MRVKFSRIVIECFLTFAFFQRFRQITPLAPLVLDWLPVEGKLKINMYPGRTHLIALIFLAVPAVAQAQFNFTTNNGAITITGYTGSGGAVVIPGTTNGYPVTGIGKSAFAYCTNLTSVTIPNNITNIGEAVFLGSANLTNISVNASNPSYSSTTNGVLLDKGQGTLIQYPEGLTNDIYTLPNGVTNIGPYAFASCFRLTTVSIPYQVKSIGEFAFSECSGLTNVTIAYTIIGYLQQGITNIGFEAFSYCTSLISVSTPVTNNATIGGLAFAFCTNLTSAFLWGNAPPDFETAFYGDPDAIVYYAPETTGWSATFGDAPTMAETPAFEFEYSTSNGSVTITGYNGSYGTVVIPNTINGYVVTSIGQRAFFDNNQVTNITIDDAVTNIGTSAFTCPNLISVTIPGSVTNFDYAFESCSILASVTIDNGVSIIGDGAFQYCQSLTSIVMPNSVISIAQSAFENCSSLASVTIPAGVTNISNSAFEGCISLTSAYFEGNAPPNPGYAFSFKSGVIVYYLPGTTGWGLTFGGAPTELWNPHATAFVTAGAQFGFNITGPTNVTIVVEACTNLANPIWLPVSTNMLSGATSSFTDPQRANFPNRYYRFSAP